MRTLFVGDVHGCAQALDALVGAAHPERLILLGDLFTKGPDPRGVWERIAAWKPECVLGNHDAKVLRMWEDRAPGKVQDCCRKLPEAAREYLAALPSFIEGVHAGRPWIAVHGGLHPTLGRAGTDPVTAYLLRRWPDNNDEANPFWWQIYTGEARVFYGHDALRGLQVHERTVGLDTGCCYGHALSGYLLETEEVLQFSLDGERIAPPRPWRFSPTSPA